jgi:chemotaxis protein CheD
METMVRMGELAISDTPGDVLVSLGLGSCIGLALVDRRAGVAGLAHIVLPATSGEPAPQSMNKFADHAVPTLLDGMVERGASRVFLHAALVGGASMFASAGPRTLEVGQRNAAAVRELVKARRVPVVAEAVGGSRGRTVRVDVASGTVSVREAGGVEEVLAA